MVMTMLTVWVLCNSYTATTFQWGREHDFKGFFSEKSLFFFITTWEWSLLVLSLSHKVVF